MKDEKLLTEALTRFAKAQEFERENRDLAAEDFRFAAGEQWPEQIRRERERSNRPCLTFNRLPQFIRQVTGDARQNKPAIKVVAVDSGADIGLAEVYSGLIRNIENQSRADEIYITAFENAVTGGMGGGWRVKTEYTTDDSFEQDIRLERINNPFAIWWDTGAKRFDKSDANWCFVSEWVTKEQFEGRFPKKTPTDWKQEYTNELSRHWINDERVRLAEYWVKKPVKKTIGLIQGKVIEVTPGLESYPFEMTREVDSFKVCRYLLSGHEVLEGPDEFPSKYIPIIPCYGPEEWIEDRVRYVSLIRYAKDPMRMYNFWQPLALDTPLPTPTGWTTMGSVSVGDSLYDETGKPCKVIGKSPVHINRECYRVTFDDDSSIVADAGHPWVVEERGKRKSSTYEWSKKKVTTKDLIPGDHFIDVVKPLVGSNVELPVHPYVLGLWLGDGASAGGRISVGDADAAETMRNIEACGFTVARNSTRKNADIGVNGLLVQLRAAGVLKNKHIPWIYLRASEADRLALVQGLMDSDGSISKTNACCYFSNTNLAIADGFAELLRTLGIKAKRIYREGRAAVINGQECQGTAQSQFNFTTRLPVFRLSRKAEIIGSREHQPRRAGRHGIVSVELVPSAPVQCVAIDAPSHLFLAGEGMVPTHNTTIAEKIALAPKSPWLVTPAMIAGLEDYWTRANTSNDPYLPYNPDGGMRPTREAPAMVNSAEIQQSAQAIDDLKATMGMYDASLGAQGNETSGRAIIARQREGDNATYAWIDNLARSIQHTGRILVDLIPKIYDTQRIVRILGEDGTQEMVHINWVEGMELVNDLTVGKYDVEITVGPSYGTRRMESVESMLAFVQALPQAAAVSADLIARSMDWPGAEEIAERLKKALPPGIDEESEEPQPDPMQGMAMASAKADIEGKELDNAKKQVELSAMTGEMQQLVHTEVQRVLTEMLAPPMQGPVQQGPPLM